MYPLYYSFHFHIIFTFYFFQSPQAIIDHLYARSAESPSIVERDQSDGGLQIHYNHIDALVQQDVTFIMNRTVESWKQWWTEPMPNIGLLLVKAGPLTQQMFHLAWSDYLSSKRAIRRNPGM